MKQYRIDQLREEDYYKLLNYLHDNADHTAMEEVYWVNLPDELYDTVQKQHIDCQPFYFAINLSFTSINFEWLIRSRERIHCNCIQYATKSQRDYIINFADNLLKELEIKL